MKGPVVFSKASCPFCTASKKKLKDMGATFTVQELDKLSMLSSVLRLLSRLFMFILMKILINW